MARKARSTPTPLTEEELNVIMMKSVAEFKGKSIDLDSVITRANVKKYLTVGKLNKKPEEWLTVVKKVGAGEELTDDDTAKLDEAKQAVAEFLEGCTDVQQSKFGGADSDNVVLSKAVCSFKYKFSIKAFDIITHVVNMFVRELVIYANEECLATKLRVVNPSHIPWAKLQDKLLAGVYFNTLTVFQETHQPEEECEDEECEAEEEVDTDAEVEAVVVKKIKLQQYIQTMFKSIRSSEERFNELKLSKKLIQVVNDIVFQVLDRYANVLKTLLDVSASKTVNDKFALQATKLILQDHVFATVDKTRVVLDVLQERLERLHELHGAKVDDEADDADDEVEEDAVEEEVVVEEPVVVVSKKAGRAVKK